MLLFKTSFSVVALFLTRDRFLNSLSLFLASSSTPSYAAAHSTSRTMVPTPNGVVIFCHGSGDTGPGARHYVESVAPKSSLQSLRNAGIAIHYPSARPRPYRLMGNSVTSIWFDRIGGLEPSYPEDVESVEESSAMINAIIDDYIDAGVPPSKIVVGGFSMGGGIGLQVAARCRHGLGAVFALSSYLCDDSVVYEILGQRPSSTDDGGRVMKESSCDDDDSSSSDGGGGSVPALLSSPVFMAHGDDDDFILTEWGERTADRLRGLGVSIFPQPFLRIPDAHHEMTRHELRLLFDFLISNVFEAN